MENASKNFFGADIWINQHGFSDSSNFQSLDQIRLTSYLENFKNKFPGKIKNYTFISYPLEDIIGRHTTLSALNGIVYNYIINI